MQKFNCIIFLSWLLCFCELVENEAVPSGLNNYNGRQLGITGGQQELDPKDNKYLDLAKESLLKYATESGDGRTLDVARVEKVTTQVVAGSLTRINFVVKTPDNVEFNCNSKIWEKPWENFKEITVSCETDKKQRKKRCFAGGLEAKDPRDKKYFELAKESLLKYATESGDGRALKVARVETADEQVVAGLLIYIKFIVKTPDNVEFNCNSKIWERQWENFKEITVSCQTYRIQAEPPVIPA